MSIKILVRVLTAASDFLECKNASGAEMRALAAFLDSRPESSSAQLGKTLNAALPEVRPSGQGISAEAAAHQMVLIEPLMIAAGASKSALKTVADLAGVLNSWPDFSLDDISLACAKLEERNQREAESRAFETARRERESAQRVSMWIDRIKSSPPTREALLSVLEKMKSEGKALPVPEWKLIARQLSGRTASSKKDADRIIRDWITFAARLHDSGASVERAHAEGF